MRFWVRGKASISGRCDRVGAEQCLPQEDATLQRDAGATKCGRGIPFAARSPLRGRPSCDAPGRIVSKEFQPSLMYKVVRMRP